ncbi:MAG: hypothetical protein QG608_2426 [Actinomycetota bacterium]|nr:hypothetical protein [Actinomycetota bacterium]
MTPDHPAQVGERTVLGRAVRICSLTTLVVVLLGSLVITYRQIRQDLPFQQGTPVPDWAYPTLVMGIVVGGALGVTAAVVEDRPQGPAWALMLTGTFACLAWTLWEGWGTYDRVELVFAGSSPVVMLLVFAELMRQLRLSRE